MKELVLKSVSRPMMLFYAPFFLAILNISVQFFVMMLIFLITQKGEAVFMIITIIFVHLILMYIGKKDPHFSSMLVSYFNTPRTTKNIVQEQCNKFIP